MEALQTPGVLGLPVISRRCEDLRSGQGSSVPATGLALSGGRPAGVETFLLHGLVGPELDDHEVGGGGEALALQVEAAGQGGDGGGRLLSPASAQDLNGVENLLRLKLRELKCEVCIRTELNCKLKMMTIQCEEGGTTTLLTILQSTNICLSFITDPVITDCAGRIKIPPPLPAQTKS